MSANLRLALGRGYVGRLLACLATLAGFASLACLATPAAGTTLPYVESAVGARIGPYGNGGDSRILFGEVQVAAPSTAIWIRVHFDQFQLGPLDFVRIIDAAGNSYDIQGRQVDRNGGLLRRGEYFSLFFNGSWLEIELYAQPGSNDEGISIDYIHYGLPPADGGSDGECIGAEDPGTDTRSGRLISLKVHEVTGDTFYEVCSATALFPGDCILTDGDCMECTVADYCVDPNKSGSAIVEFDVPESLAGADAGGIQHPLPRDQYRIRPTPAPCIDPTEEIVYGFDYAVFVVAPNEKTGLSHAAGFSASRLIRPLADKAVVVEGFPRSAVSRNHVQLVDEEALVLDMPASEIHAVSGTARSGSEGSAVRSFDGRELYGIANEPICTGPLDPEPLQVLVTSFNDPALDPDEEDSCTNLLCNAPHGFIEAPGLRPLCGHWEDGVFIIEPCDGEAHFQGDLVLSGATLNLDLAGILGEIRGAKILRYDNRFEIDTEIETLDVDGTSCSGPVHVRLQLGEPSLGRITQSTAALYPADSFFDVFLEIEINGVTLHNETPLHLAASIHSLEAYGETYLGPTGPLTLVDAQGVPTASLLNVRLTPQGVQERHSASLQLNASPFGMLTANGTVDRVRGATAWDPIARTWRLPVETLRMELRGTHPTLGPFVVRESASLASSGALLFEADPSTTYPFPARGQFEVFYELEFPQSGQAFVTQEPLRLEGTLSALPPTGEVLSGQGSVVFYDKQSGLPAGTLLGASELVQSPVAWAPPPAPGEVRYCAAAQVVVDLGQGPLTLTGLDGSGVVDRNPAQEQIDGLDRVPMELVSLSLHADTSPLGAVSVWLHPLRQTLGAMVATGSGSFYPASSDLDLFLAIVTPQGTLYNLQPFRVHRLQPHPEPDGPEPDPYLGQMTGVQLVNGAGQPRGFLQYVELSMLQPQPVPCSSGFVCGGNPVTDAPVAPSRGAGFVLHPNVPNPFNPRTLVSFELPEQVIVTVKIHDVSGRAVRTLLQGELLPSGRKNLLWDGNDDQGRGVASGVYICRVLAGAETASRRMVLVR